MSASGFPADNFYFGGYLSKTESERETRLLKMKDSGCTSVLYESSHRIDWILENICDVFGNLHEIFVAREMTKLHE
jgi:16S rRNA (cytidine1402-2'-O)-methyltransferase